jgi:hypothetical protein
MKKSMAALAAAVLLGLGGMYAHSSQQQQETKPSRQHPFKGDRKDHSRSVFKGLGNPGENIPEAVARLKRDLRTVIEVYMPILDPFASPRTVYDWIKERGCEADAVIIATVKTEASFLTEDKSFLYTNHQLAVEDVLKGNPEGPLQAGDAITAARTGGTITLSGRKVSAVNKNALPLQLNKRYLLFLTYLPERGAYVADNLAYQLADGKIIRTTEAQVRPEERSGSDADTLIRTARDATSAPCPYTQGGPQ